MTRQRPHHPISVGLLHPTFESWGGAEWFIHDLASELVEQKEMEMTVYTHRWSAPAGVDPPYTIQEHRMGGALSAPWDWTAIGHCLGPLWRRHHVLFAHNHPSLEWVARSPTSLPVVWYCHEPPRFLWETSAGAERSTGTHKPFSRLRGAVAFYGLRLPWQTASTLLRTVTGKLLGRAWIERLRASDRAAVSRCTGILANSRYTAERIRAIYGREAVVAYPLTRSFDTASPKDLPEKELLLLWVGRLTSTKRPLELLDAWEHVVPQVPEAGLVMVGDGPLRDAVAQRIASLGPEGRTTLRTFVPSEELRELYRNALLTVHLASGEPFGLVPLESMWEGTPVLAVCEGGVAETVEPGQTGWCLDSLDPRVLASRLVALLRDSTEVRALGLQAARTVRGRFDPEETIHRIASLLRSAVSRRVLA